MLLCDIFDQLTYGELRNLELGGVDADGMDPINYTEVIPHINLALLELYKRFPLKTNELILRQHDQIQRYLLHSDYAVTNVESTQPIKYIHDSRFDPFTDDVLKIERIYNEDGEELYNDEFNEFWSIHIPAYNMVQIPWPEKENNLLVVYQASPAPVPFDITVPGEVEVHIPPPLLEPLLAYVGGRMQTSRGGEAVQEGNNYMAKFEASIQNVSNLNLLNKVNHRNNKLDCNGWV